jgi:hypothetical protein
MKQHPEKSDYRREKNSHKYNKDITRQRSTLKSERRVSAIILDHKIKNSTMPALLADLHRYTAFLDSFFNQISKTNLTAN